MIERRGFMSGIVGGILGFLLGTPQKFMGASWKVTIKNDLVPGENKVYEFADPKFIGESYVLKDTEPLPAVVCEGKEQMLFVETMDPVPTENVPANVVAEAVSVPFAEKPAFAQRRWQRIAWEDLKEGMVIMSVYTDGKELGEVERFVVGPGGYMGLNDKGIKYISVKEGSTHDFLAEAHMIGLETENDVCEKIVSNLLGIKVEDRDPVLDELRERDYTLWTLVRNRLKELRDGIA